MKLFQPYARRYGWLSACLFALLTAPNASAADAFGEAIESLRGAGAKGAGFKQALPAAVQLRQLPSDQVTRLLDGMKNVNPIAENWIRGVVFDVSRKSDPPSVSQLAEYAMDQSNNPIGRGLAMELVRLQDAGRAATLIGQCLDDPSLPLREMAVEQAIGQAEDLKRSDKTAAAVTRYREALSAARHPKQLSRILEALDKLGQPVATSEAFALITRWQSAAPFDNVNGVGFDKSYPPEIEFESTATIDLDKKYSGKNGSVGWRVVEAPSEDGKVDIAAAYDKEKGAVAYLFCEFESSVDRPAEIRMGCPNANKVWLNGKQVMATEVYHAGNMIDQYIADCQLRKGTNRILVKVCQNEQTDSWAQEWQVQFRLTDPSGKNLRSGN